MLAKKIALGFGIAIILPMLVHYGVSSIYPEPKWDEYVSNDSVSAVRNSSPQEQEKRDIEREKKQKEYENAKKIFGARLFFVEIPVAIIAVVIGAFLSIQSIGAGLLFGGIFCATDGYWEYWSDLQDWIKFLSLLICFIVLIVLGYRKMGNKS